MKNWLKWSIIGLVVVIVVLMVGIYFMLSNSKEDDGVTVDLNTATKENVIVEYASEWHDVQNISLAYDVEQCIQKFYSFVSEGNVEAVYNSLDKDYVSKNNISESNVFSVLNMKRGAKFVICNVQYLENENITAFRVRGIDVFNQGSANRYYVVKVDFLNGVFSIYPMDKNPENVELTNTINSAGDNVFANINLTEEEEAKEYLINFKYQALYNSEGLFNNFDKQLWSSYDEFKSFIAGFKFSEVVKDYSVMYNNDNTVYTVTDSNDNRLVFTVVSAMDYSVRIN